VTDSNVLIREEVARLPAYNAGVSLASIQSRFPDGQFAKLDSNENPMGCCQGAKDAMARAIADSERYPEPSPRPLFAHLSSQLAVPSDHLILGNGSEELIQVIYHTVLRPGDHVVTVVPSFGLHELYAAMMGARVTKLRVSSKWRFPVESLIRAANEDARILVLSSPSNPMGIRLSSDEFDQLVSGVPAHTLIILDEAYIEYLPEADRNDGVRRLAQSQNPWLVLRTFSKAYGLAGVRIGYGAAYSGALVEAMVKVRTPFNVNALAIAAATAALEDVDHLSRCTSTANAERERMAGALRGLGFGIVESTANFLFVDAGRKAVDFAAEAREVGVFVKPWREAGFENYFRVSAGLAEENDRFLAFAREQA